MKKIISLLSIFTLLLSLVSCKISFKEKEPNNNPNINEPNPEEPNNPENPSNNEGEKEEINDDFRLVVYYLDQKNVYENLKKGSIINLNDYIPSVDGYEFKGWYYNNLYSFKRPDDCLNVELIDFEDVKNDFYRRTDVTNDRTVYAYAKMIKFGEEDVIVEPSWSFSEYHEYPSTILSDLNGTQTKDSIKHFNFEFDVKKDGDSFVGYSNFETTYYFQTLNYTETLKFTDNEKKIVMEEDNGEFSSYNSNTIMYDFFKLETLEDFQPLFYEIPNFYGCYYKTINKNLFISKDNYEIIFNLHVTSYDVKVNATISISNGKVVSNVEVTYNDNDCRVRTKVIDNTILNLNIKPEFTYKDNEIVGIKFSSFYQE